MSLPIPAILATHADERAEWMGQLPAMVAKVTAMWDLDVDSPYEPGGACSWTAPVEQHGEPRALKVGLRHVEAEFEAEALRAWHGRGAVEVHEAYKDGDFCVLLLERCEPGRQLKRMLPEPEQDPIVAGILRRLWIEPDAGHPFPPLAEMCEQWARECEERAERTPPEDLGLLREGLALWRELPQTADRQVLLATDLHGDNILQSQREPWLIVDPKPYVGDATYDPLQHMLNCDIRLQGDTVDMVHRMADLTGVDRHRLRAWLFARVIVDSETWTDAFNIARRVAP